MKTQRLQHIVHLEWAQFFDNAQKRNDIETASHLIAEMALRTQATTTSVQPSTDMTLLLPYERILYQTLSTQLCSETDLTPDSVFAQYHKRLKNLLDVHFPFTNVSKTLSEEALAISSNDTFSLNNSDVITILFKKQIQKPQFTPESPDWKEMHFVVENLTIHCLGEILRASYLQYKNQRDPLTRQFFHTLLTMIFYRYHPIPPLSNSSTIDLDSILKESFENLDFTLIFKLSHEKIRIIELILCSKFSFMPFVDQPSLMAFVSKSLQTIPFILWPDKKISITKCLEKMTQEEKRNLALMLSSSLDHPTKTIGQSLKKALSASTHAESYPWIYQLLELLPHMNHLHIANIFQICLPRLAQDTLSEQLHFEDPDFVVRLNFNVEQKILTHGNLIIGIYKQRNRWGDIEPHLMVLAFDVNTHRLMWRLPLETRPIYYDITPLGFILIYPQDSNIDIFDLQNGEKTRTASLPMKTFLNQNIHIAPSGFCYCVTQKEGHHILHGGEISADNWRSTFTVEIATENVKPLGNYVYYQDTQRRCVVIYSQNGSAHTISHCTEAILKNGRLFTIEKTPSGSRVSMQEVDESGIFQLKGSRQELAVTLSNLKLVEIFNNEVIVCLQHEDDLIPYFIDISNQKWTKGQQNIPSSHTYYADPHTNTLYSWDASSEFMMNQSFKPLWAHTPQSSTQIGTLKKGQGMSLLHIDQNNRFYFVPPTPLSVIAF